MSRYLSRYLSLAITSLAVVVLLALGGAEARPTHRYYGAVPRVVSVDLYLGSAYFVRNNVARSASHIFRVPRAFVDAERGDVTCRDEKTDSVLMSVEDKSRQTLPEGHDRPAVGDRLTAAGWRGGEYVEEPVEYHGLVDSVVVAGETPIGPLYLFRQFFGDARGMSGGPVVNSRGEAVATISTWGYRQVNGVSIYSLGAVPIWGSACRVGQ